MPNWVQPCPNCPRTYKAIGGDGPRPAPVLAIMERPGQVENAHGRVADGKTGQELDELYLPLAGLDRSEIRVINCVLCWADNNKTPTDKEVAQCAPHHVPQEIERTNPKVILLCGSTACSLVSGVRLDYMHGIPQHTSKVGDLFGWEGWLIPLYHPSIGLHESRWMQICMEDWEGLRHLIGQSSFEAGDQYRFEGDPEPEPVRYELCYQEIAGMHPRIAVDTESHGGKPWSIQWSGYRNTGYMIRADDARAVAKFSAWLRDNDTEIIFHNAAYDLEVLRQLDIPVRSFRDTMQEAFALGNLPQGLKALAYRLFRHTMTSYEETVRPASLRALISWMTEAYIVASTDLAFVERVQMKTKVKEVVRKGPLESLLQRLLRLTSVESDYDPWERLTDFWHDECNEWMVNYVESRCGHYPILGIANCSMPDAISYAVADADWTGRVAVELARRRGQAFKIYEGDRDA